jgi:hypothetical protein
LALAAALLAAAPSAPRLPRFSPQPPGTVVQDTVAYLSGQAMNSKWHVIASKKGRQWYLSVYAPAYGDVAHLAFQSPGNSGLLAKVVKPKGSPLYFPFQELKVVGAAQLEQPAVEDAVIWLHESGADCGAATVAILGADRNMHVRIRKQISNYCSLDAAIVKESDLSAVRLRGPYYTATSAVCCPAKPRATALLRGKGGRWNLSPPLFPPAGSRLP